MLELHIPQGELFDFESSKIVKLPAIDVRLEHSLLSMSKWESKWEIAFQSKFHKKTPEQIISYVEMMEIDGKYGFGHRLTAEQIEKVNELLQAKRSATWFNDEDRKTTGGNTVTSELIYYWMTAFNIPFECDKWPLNRLLNLVKICMIKHEEQTKKKSRRSRSEMLSERSALNAKRLADMKEKS